MHSFNDKLTHIYQLLYFVIELSRNTLNVRVQVDKQEVKSVQPLTSQGYVRLKKNAQSSNDSNSC